MSQETAREIHAERDGRVAMITANRPTALHAFNGQLMPELTTAAAEFGANPGINTAVVTGPAKEFSAGADIEEMADLSFADVFGGDHFAAWGRFGAVRTPSIAAVPGYAMSGGCELAMMCDLLIVTEPATLGQPEIKLAVPAAMGGSQRLTPATGNAKAMVLILAGRNMGAYDVERAGLVSGVVRRRAAASGQGGRHHDLRNVAVGHTNNQGARQPAVRDHSHRWPTR
jgi:enoyl-CoA hydratase